MCLILENVIRGLEKNVYSALGGCNVLKISIKCKCSVVLDGGCLSDVFPAFCILAYMQLSLTRINVYSVVKRFSRVQLCATP